MKVLVILNNNIYNRECDVVFRLNNNMYEKDCDDSGFTFHKFQFSKISVILPFLGQFLEVDDVILKP